MSTGLKKKKAPAAAELAVESVSRKPQQGRSRASFERMLAAARELMVERGNEEFTLLEVSQRGNVSIGSIYLRFESKDNLVRAVIASALDEIAVDEDRMLEAVRAISPSLSDFVPNYVKAFAEVLRHHAPLLRLSMERASYDPLVSEPGKKSATRSADQAKAAMLDYGVEFGGRDRGVKADAAYHIIFATLARHLALGSTGESALGHDWEGLKRELGRMCLAYLKADI
jgi:AcrR family transcriptional regulator